MFPRSLQWRLVTFFCLIIFCLVIPIGLYLNSRIESKYYDDFRKRIERDSRNGPSVTAPTAPGTEDGT